MSEPLSGADLLKRIRPRLAEESTQICLRPDLIEAWTEADDELSEITAAPRKPGRLGTKPEGQVELAEKVRDLEQQIEDNSVTFRFRALSKDRWRALCDDHPPRKGNEVDLYVGFDRDAVLDQAVRLSLVDPVFDEDSWAEFVDVCSAGEWEELRKTANSVNRGVVDAPKSALASQILAKRKDASVSPETGE